MRFTTFACSLLFTSILLSPARAQCSGACGDCDENGTFVTILDALTAARIGASLIPSTPQKVCVCDVDMSTTVTILDSLRIAQAAAGLMVTLDCGGPTLTLRSPTGAVDPVDCPFDLGGSIPSADLDFDWSTNGGSTWQQATAHASSPLQSPASSVSTGSHTFVWDSQADASAGRPVMASLRITATAAGGASASAVHAGIPLPFLGGTPVLTLTGGVAVDPVDSGFDIAGVPVADLCFDYSIDSGFSWSTATAHVTSLLASPAIGATAGAGLTFIWDSDADVAAGARPATAQLRITATDPVSMASDSGIHTGITLNPPMAMGTGTCLDPFIVTPGALVSGNTAGQGNDSYPDCSLFSGAEDVTYSLTLASTRDVTVDLTNPSYSAAIYVQTVCAIEASEIGCDDSGPTWQIFLPGLAAGTYYIWVDGSSTAEGTYDLRVTVN